MVIDLNSISQVLCNRCEFEKILRNNVVLWQAYIAITLYSNPDPYDIQLTLASDNKYAAPITLTLRGEVDHDYSKDPLTFIAEEPGSTVQFHNAAVAAGTVVQYSTEKDVWRDYDSSNVITLADTDDFVSFRAKTTNATFTYDYNFSRFYLTGKVKATGNLMSLLDKDQAVRTIPPMCFENLFRNQAALTEMPYIVADQISGSACVSMFENCTSLTELKPMSASISFAETYSSMFKGCTSLTDASGLSVIISDPGVVNDNGPCAYMFNGCTALVKPPALPSTKLYTNGYAYMFSDCTALPVMPELPATNAEFWSNGCYSHMFENCTSLKKCDRFRLQSHADTYGSNARFAYMFAGCSSMTDATVSCNFNGGIDYMFKDCSSLSCVGTAMTSMTNSQYSKWLEGVPNTSKCVFRCPNELSSSINNLGRSDSTVPSNWMILYNDEPEPVAYTPLQYLTMSGRQHIDTQVVPTDVETKMKFNMTSFDLVGGLLQHANPAYYQVCYYQGNFNIGTAGSEYVTVPFSLNTVHEITYNQVGTHDFIVDGTVAKSGITNVTAQNSSPLLIGGYRPNVSYDNGATIVFYGAKLTNRSDGTVLRDFIPAKDGNGVTCVYDKVSRTFFYNKGTGDFIPGPEARDVQLEYIQSDGNQWIDTEFKPCASTQYDLNYMLTATCTTTWPSIFGTRNGELARYTVRYVNTTTSRTGFFQRSASPTSNRIDMNGLTQAESVGKQINCKLQNNSLTADGTSFGSFPDAINDDEFPYSIYLFAVNTKGSVYPEDVGTNIRIYDVTFFDKDGNALARIIPIRKADGTICMYDTVREKYLYNKGTGDFTPGPEKTT